MSQIDRIIVTPAARPAGALTFGMIFAGESLLRALNVSVIPLQAYELLGSSQRVSMVSTFVSLSVLIATLSLPVIFARFRRRWIYTMGVAFHHDWRAAVHRQRDPGAGGWPFLEKHWCSNPECGSFALYHGQHQAHGSYPY